MRLPIRSETEAVRFVFAGGAVIAISVLLGWLTTPLVGVGFFVAALVVGAIAYLRAPNPEHPIPFADAENEPHPHGGAAGTRRVLVVANQALSGDELRQRLTDMGERLELDVLACLPRTSTTPCLTSTASSPRRASGLTSRLRGPAGAASSPAEKSAIAIRPPRSRISWRLRGRCGCGVTHPRERETWQEQGELERLRRELHVPVAHVMVGAGTGHN